MKRFMCWWGGIYPRTTEEHGTEFFEIDNGYAQEDIDETAELEVGTSVVLDDGNHIVTRVE